MDTIEFKGEVVSCYELSKEELIPITEGLYKEALELRKEAAELRKENAQLKDRLSLNSKNSSKSPSTDINKPDPKSSRPKTNKNPGGQEGHKGTTLKQSDTPDTIEIHTVEACENCTHSLEGVETEVECRQVIDIIPAKQVIVEHRVCSKTCPGCGCVNTAKFPEGVGKAVQYGANIKAKSVYYHERQLVPYGRVKEIIKDEYGIDISVGTLVKFNEECHKKTSFPSSVIKKKIIESSVGGFDETGVKVNGKLNWIHTASTDKLTYFETNPRRGKKGVESAGIFQNFTGTAVHDHWGAYFENKNCAHGLCNAHHIRELTFAEERYKQGWAIKMKALLIKMNEEVKASKASGILSLDKKTIKKHEGAYSKILREGVQELPKIGADERGKRGRTKKHKVENLHNRLRNFKKETLAFMYNFSVPFTNNQAERDHRMEKVKQKISGGHRSRKGAKVSCRIRGYLSTAIKNGVRAVEALAGAFEGRPFIPV